MNRIITIIIGVICSLSAFSQNVFKNKCGFAFVDNVMPDVQVLDNATFKATYTFRIEIDTLKSESVENSYILLVGKGYSKFYSQDLELINNMIKSGNLPYKAFARLKNRTSIFLPMLYDCIYICDEGLTHSSRLAADNYQYNETDFAQDWTICDSITTINGYVSQLATCKWRGREYKAWFTTELPISKGPWKFCGLPGLIVSIADSTNQYSFNLTSIENCNEAIEKPEYKYNTIKKDVYRKLYLQMETDNIEFSNHHNGGTGYRIDKGADWRPEKMKYDMIERD